MELKPTQTVREHLERKTAHREIQTARLRTLLSHVENFNNLHSEALQKHIYEITTSRYLEDLIRHLTGEDYVVEVEVRYE